MKEWTLEEVMTAADKLGIDFSKTEFTEEDLLEGMNVELEHGQVDPDTNLTNDDPLLTAKIALAHLNEIPKYYNKDIGIKAWELAIEASKGDPKGKKVQID